MAVLFAEVDLNEITRLVACLKEPTFVVQNKSRLAPASPTFFPELARGPVPEELFGTHITFRRPQLRRYGHHQS